MTENCEICGNELKMEETELVIVVSLINRLRVCKECLNDYTQHDYDKLISKLKNSEEGKLCSDKEK